jgi:Skp family chaperone for outer membrane proteins
MEATKRRRRSQQAQQEITPPLGKARKQNQARDEKVASSRVWSARSPSSARPGALQDQSARMRQGIVEDINKIVNDKVKAESYDLVFDKSGMSLNGVSVVMFAKDSYDFTDGVVTQLNKNKGKEKDVDAVAATDKPAGDKPVVKPGEKAETPKKPKNP